MREEVTCPFCDAALATANPWRAYTVVIGISVGLMATACGPAAVDNDSGTSGSGSSSTTGGPSASTQASGSVTGAGSTNSTGSGDTVATTEQADSGTDAIDDSDDQGCSFYAGCSPDMGSGTTLECDIFEQDCPDGEKCMAWAADGGTWNATRCSPLDADPNQPGEACSTEGGGMSGVDSCDVGAMCWGVNAQSNVGECIAMCQGSLLDATCPEIGTVCSISNLDALAVCVPGCHPLMQDCAQNEGCIPTSSGEFACFPQLGTDGAHGEACSGPDTCDPGLTCVDAELHTSCQSDQCCSTYCDTANTDADAECQALDAGQACVAWYVEGRAPSGYDNVGVCATP